MTRPSLVTPLLVAVAVALAASPGSPAEPIGVITELSTKTGRVEVQPAGGGEWAVPRLLLSVGAGDRIRADGGARAVIVFIATQRATVVTRENSPFVAAAPAAPGLGDRMKSAAVTFLQGQQPDRAYQSLAVRKSPTVFPTIIAPRDTLVAPGVVPFAWSGSDRWRYTVRLRAADQRVVVETRDLAGPALRFTPSDTPLAPGRYEWELQTKEHGTQRAAFEVASPEAADRVRAAVAAVGGGVYPAVTAALLAAAVRMREGFYADARAGLLAAIAASPDDATLHLLLGQVYERTGLRELAADELDQADALAPR
jgi:hypothetical protein